MKLAGPQKSYAGDANMHIFVPSMNRFTAADIKAGPLADMGEDLLARTFYVVPSAQEHIYANVLPPLVQILPVDNSIQGIAQTRHYIGKTVANWVETKFVMVDDDARFLIRRKPD